MYTIYSLVSLSHSLSLSFTLSLSLSLPVLFFKITGANKLLYIDKTSVWEQTAAGIYNTATLLLFDRVNYTDRKTFFFFFFFSLNIVQHNSCLTLYYVVPHPFPKSNIEVIGIVSETFNDLSIIYRRSTTRLPGIEKLSPVNVFQTR